MQLTLSAVLLGVLSTKGLEQVMQNTKQDFYENCRKDFLKKLLTA